MSADEYEEPSYFNCDNVSERCPVELTIYGDYFTQGACIFFVAVYSILLIAQAYFGWRLKSWGFVSCLAVGAILEFMGYVGRTVLSSNPWNFGAFVIQNLMLVLGPTVVAAAISVTFKHLVIWYGSGWSLIRPKLYPWIFVGTDVVSLLIQMAGGGVAAMATGDTDPAMMNLGNNLMLAGVAFQLVNMIFCGGLILTYAWRRRQNKTKAIFVRDDSTQESSDASEQMEGAARYATSDDATKLRTKHFVWALVAAYLAIIIRCIYRQVTLDSLVEFFARPMGDVLTLAPRIPEMAMGWGSSLQKNETTFLILDGAMILSSVALLTLFHPATFFPFMGKAYRTESSAAVAEGAVQESEMASARK